MNDREAERRGEARADAARERREHARERARRAREEADAAASPESASAHRREAELHEGADRLQETAELLQRAHADEARRGGPGAVARANALDDRGVADGDEEGA